MKILLPTAIAGIASLIAGVHSADALSCGTNNVVWEEPGLCNSPNQNRGFAQGGGVLNTPLRVLSISVTSDGQNTGGTALGLNSDFQPASGEEGVCEIDALPGQFLTTPEGFCDDGAFHRLTISFD